ncbi:UDP-3-O-(3-hydroxymyristoyl)glucosamine N-acyltransferase [Marivivens sp. LCG002]|uniref:UDP-3-O-(3-hydroxymyristoyl)glucosamine N-acyltransferase n=1 Tax=Marivivens sp. LCG002 TaxID=3051171 RepID=UPI00255740E3|nr:UDP-3-O-(3-hydroxymyristoyl)glucosamine N-acyltransferase [Marivivens sp. LCG002]WIV52178.1 UDP-3-O-(3-hydroxymyristoyl)glucosamine N-acyltransferase [Marivivens sp. LCG002]
MSHSVQEIAQALGAECFGDVSLRVSGASEPSTAGSSDLALAMAPAYGDQLKLGQARAAVVWPGADWEALGLKAAIIAPRARLAMARLTQMLDSDEEIAKGIHSTALIGQGAQIGEGVDIGPFAVIGEGAVIGKGTRIGAHVVVSGSAVIGEGCLILEGAKIRRRVVMGDRCIVHPNAVIGGDGFSFVTEQEANVERARSSMGEEGIETPSDGTWHRIHSLGGVVIGNDCEIGCNTTIDAGTIRPTRIGNGCKIDNLVQVGHNVVLGNDCLLAGKSGVAGSTVVGDRVVVGGGALIADNLKVGSDVVITGNSGVSSNVPEKRVMMGYPAVPIQTHVDMYKALRRLPRFMKDFTNRQKTVSNSDETS